jgi:energy-coupling factor transport system ATP-binding protein
MSDPLIDVRGLCFSYYPGAGGSARRALDGIDLCIGRGEFVAITGPSGCGKTTLCRCLAGLIPHMDQGEMAGDVRVAGVNTRDCAPGELARRLAMTFQSPDDQLFSNSAEAEVAFGPENAGMAPREIGARVAWALEAAGAGHLRGRLVDELSGGEKQRLAIASSLALRPEGLLLDEPTSELDPATAFGLFETLRHLNREAGITVVVVEHRLERLYGTAGRLVVLDRGRVVADGTFDEVFGGRDLSGLGIFVPPAVAFSLRQRNAPGSGWRARPRSPKGGRGRCVLSLKDVRFAYPKSEAPALDGVSLDLYAGELAVIMGANGSGKTTLVKHTNGLLRPDGGQVLVEGEGIARRTIAQVSRQVGVVFQDPDHQLFSETVSGELAFGPENVCMPPGEVRSRVEGIAGQLGLAGVLACSPFTLSGGEKQRVAIASALTLDPVALVLDEPMLGLNYGLKEKLAQVLDGLKRSGRAVIVVTHDVEFAAAHADRVIVMAKGRIMDDGDPRRVLTSDEIAAAASLHLPQATLVGRSVGLPDVLGVDEIVPEDAG